MKKLNIKYIEQATNIENDTNSISDPFAGTISPIFDKRNNLILIYI
jgi:hypothetical protein